MSTLDKSLEYEIFETIMFFRRAGEDTPFAAETAQRCARVIFGKVRKHIAARSPAPSAGTVSGGDGLTDARISEVWRLSAAGAGTPNKWDINFGRAMYALGRGSAVGDYVALKDCAIAAAGQGGGDARPIVTAPQGEWVLFWWIGAPDKKKESSGWVLGMLGQLRGEDGVWDGERHRPIEWFTHWRPLPPAPRSAAIAAKDSTHG